MISNQFAALVEIRVGWRILFSVSAAANGEEIGANLGSHLHGKLRVVWSLTYSVLFLSFDNFTAFDLSFDSRVDLSLKSLDDKFCCVLNLTQLRAVHCCAKIECVLCVNDFRKCLTLFNWICVFLSYTVWQWKMLSLIAVRCALIAGALC